jgi:hypothetical protein
MSRRLGRAATFAFGAALAASGVSACNESHGPSRDAGVQDSGGIAPLYGAVPADSGVEDSGGIAPAYGAVPVDGG